MILEQLQVANWRVLRQPVTLENLSPGVNIVYGPNEAGKSSLMDAICRAFFDRCATGGSDIAARQPWDSALPPKVAITFAIGEKRYRVDKQFLVDPSCRLCQFHDGRWEPIAEGREADQRLAELAAGETTRSGLTKAEHWGIGQVLWTPQGQLCQLAVGDSQQARLRSALKMSLQTPAGGALEQAVAERYAEIYTPNGRFRGGQNRPELLDVEDELDEARKRLLHVEENLRAAEAAGDELAAAEEQRDEIERQLQRAQQQAEKARDRLDATAEQRRAYEALQAQAEAAQKAWAELNERVRAIADADASAAEARQAVEQARQRLQRAGESASAAEAGKDAAAEAHQAAGAQLRTARRRRQQAEKALESARLAGRREELQDQLTAARQLQQQINQAAEELRSIAAPDAEALADLDALDRRRRDAEAQLKAAALKVCIQPQAPLDVTVAADDDAAEDKHLAEPAELLAATRMRLEIPGLGRIEIRAGSGAEDLAEQLDDLDRQWRGELAAYAAEGLEDLRRRWARREQIRQRLEDLRARSAQADAEKLAEAIAHLDRRREALAAELDEHAAAQGPADAQAAAARPPAIDTAEAELAEAAAAEQQAGDDQAAAAGRLEEALAASSQQQTRLHQAREELAAAEARQQERSAAARRLREADGLDDPLRLARRGEALQQADQARQRLDATEPPPAVSLATDLAELQQQIKGLGERLRQGDRRTAELAERLREMGAAGLYGQKARLAEQIETLQRRQQRLGLAAGGIKLLHETLSRHKAELFEELTRPVARTVTTWLGELAGPKYEAVTFGSDLRPESLCPRGRQASPAVDDLSFGTQEQLMLLVRLALARVLGSQAGQRECVILDDPLVHADPARQRRAMRLLAAAAEHAQLLIFTCHVEAYESLGEANRYDLLGLQGR